MNATSLNPIRVRIGRLAMVGHRASTRIILMTARCTRLKSRLERSMSPPKHGRTVCCLSFAFFCALASSAAWSAEPTGHTYSLFDGKSLNGWTVVGECEIVPDEGSILLKGGDGWLRSDFTYGDFKLHLEWKALKEPPYDSGIYLRSARDGKPFPKPAYQVNLLTGKEGNIGSLPGAESTGLVKPGEWNTFEITVIGDTVKTAINGREAYQVSGIKQATGYIGLQCEVPKGGQFRFRNLTITEFGYENLFNGKDLAGWEGAGAPAEKCWKVENGTLLCTGEKGPWLRSAVEYGNFELRYEYQVSQHGNSGIFVRVPANGNHHRADDKLPPAGFEVQVLDDVGHKNLKPYQYTGSVYDIAPATEHVCKPVGEWNTMGIRCQDQHIVITHNGVVVVDADEEHFPLLKLRETKGFLGLQNHSTLVKFRNLRLAK